MSGCVADVEVWICSKGHHHFLAPPQPSSTFLASLDTMQCCSPTLLPPGGEPRWWDSTPLPTVLDVSDTSVCGGVVLQAVEGSGWVLCLLLFPTEPCKPHLPFPAEANQGNENSMKPTWSVHVVSLPQLVPEAVVCRLHGSAGICKRRKV